MLALTSTLDSKHDDIVNKIIFDFENEFGLKQIQATPFPHITYLTTEAFNLNLLKSYLERFCFCSKPFHVYTTGIGVFPGEHPVIYIPVLRTQPLNKFHAQLFKDISKLSIEVGQFSQPKLWLPHISLALHDTSLDMMTPMFKYLSRYNFDWDIKIDNLNILKRSEIAPVFEKEAEYFLPQPIIS
ncbi:2'-5' RNA ligase family protein [Adhaeribacter aquaticus]|uniref:2'-5' RNA ligase family protein n=1 Tax=Adhaeribacter aquaticus TaxID=299567 RepID=UPI0003F67CCF|nr:2'-5' RNA ligase family protein [Adhaeribacter aquaticus]